VAKIKIKGIRGASLSIVSFPIRETFIKAIEDILISPEGTALEVQKGCWLHHTTPVIYKINLGTGPISLAVEVTSGTLITIIKQLKEEE
jgi:hypothetical protein